MKDHLQMHAVLTTTHTSVFSRLSNQLYNLVWQPVVSCTQTFNWLFDNPFDNRLYVWCIQPVVKPIVQSGLTTGWMNSGCSFNRLSFNRLSNRFRSTGCQTSLTTGLRTGCIVYTNIQPVVWQPFWQPAVWCIQPVVKLVVQSGLTTGWTNSGCSFNRLSYRFRSTGCQTGCQTSLTTGLTTGWMFVYMIQPVVKPGCTTGLTTGCVMKTGYNW